MQTFLNNVLHPFTVATVLMALTWIACAAVFLAGLAMATALVRAAQHVIQKSTCSVRSRRAQDNAQSVTVRPTDSTTKVINLDHYRHSRSKYHGRLSTTAPANNPESRPDGPA
ncbi:hypothetical protein [Haloechinothrix salitolerans]|uniref:Uncharacterized protein n=1 Tax=Haloechinothrix salitolerans TaxID=926830 RepID=A0ABW2BVP2_9PSEU